MTRTFSFTYNGTSNSNWRVLLWNKSSKFAHLMIHHTTGELGWWDYSFHGFGVIIANSTDTDISLACTGASWALTVDSVLIGTFTAFDVETYGFQRVGEGEFGALPLVNALYPSPTLYPSSTLYPGGSDITYANGTMTSITISDDGPQYSRLGVATPGNTEVVSNGDGETGVVITVNGPCNIPMVTNSTTGEFIRWNYNVLTGETLVIDTNAATVYIGDVSAIQYLDILSTFWKLVPGTNSVVATENGSPTSADISITWQDKYIGF